jgi:hypothetical protein
MSQNYAFISYPLSAELFVYKYVTSTSASSGTAYIWVLSQIISVAGLSSFTLVSNTTLLIASQGGSSAAAAGVYLYKYNSTSLKYYQSVFLPCAVSSSQGQLPVAITTAPYSQIVAGGPDGAPGELVTHIHYCSQTCFLLI